jgi:hypothetical protein
VYVGISWQVVVPIVHKCKGVGTVCEGPEYERGCTGAQETAIGAGKVVECRRVHEIHITSMRSARYVDFVLGWARGCGG